MPNTFPVQIHSTLAPVDGINACLDVAPKAGIRPICRGRGQSVPDRVAADAIGMVGEVSGIAQLVFPIALLPHRLRVPGRTGRARHRAQARIAMFGEPGFDKPSAGRKISVAWGQCPDAVQRVGHDDHGVDVKRTWRAHVFEGVAQGLHVLSRCEYGAPFMRHQREEEAATRGECAAVLHGCGCVRRARRLSCRFMPLRAKPS